MEIGDKVVLPDGSQGVVKQLPRTEGRKRPRCLLTTQHGDKWLFLDEVKPVQNQQLEGT